MSTQIELTAQLASLNTQLAAAQATAQAIADAGEAQYNALLAAGCTEMQRRAAAPTAHQQILGAISAARTAAGMLVKRLAPPTSTPTPNPNPNHPTPPAAAPAK